MAWKLVKTVSLNDWFEFFVNFTVLMFVLEVIENGPHFDILRFINISLIELIKIREVKQVLLLFVHRFVLLPSRVLVGPIFIKLTELTFLAFHVVGFDTFSLFEAGTSKSECCIIFFRLIIKVSQILFKFFINICVCIYD